MSNFNLGYSENYLRLKAAVEAARERCDAAAALPFEDTRPARDELYAAIDALKETEESKFLDEIQAVESDACKSIMDAEVGRRGRMTAVLSFVPPEAGDYPTMDKAIADHAGFGDVAFDGAVPYGGLLSVFADMRKLSAANVAAILRAMAEQIEDEGVVVCQGAHPIKGGVPCFWMANELVTGELRHCAYRNEPGDA